MITESHSLLLPCRSGMKDNDGPMERAASIRLSSRRKAVDPVDEFRANHRTEGENRVAVVALGGWLLCGWTSRSIEAAEL